MSIPLTSAASWLADNANTLHGTGWEDAVQDFLASDAGQGLCARLDERLRAGAVVVPPEPFRALRLTPRPAVRVVILGQDPYHGEGQANGLAFSVHAGVPVPPSLRNIFKELGIWGPERKTQGGLEGWAAQGVLLLNTVLTTELGQAAAHAGWGWERLTDALIQRAAAQPHVVFMLWGSHAQAKRALIGGDPGRVLCCYHPSPLSATRGPTPFMGSGVFQRANAWLEAAGVPPVDWAAQA
jgi:uracil-DNA glycosylase